MQQELVNVTKNGRQIVRVSREAPLDDKAATRSAERAAWERVVAALSASRAGEGRRRSLEGAQSRLRRHRRAHHRERRGEGTGVHTDDVTDISPVRGARQVEGAQVFRLWRPQQSTD